MSNRNLMLQARSSVLMGFTEHCRRHQINPIHILARENLAPALLRSQDLRFPYESFVRVLDHAAGESKDPLFSLTLSLRNGIETLGPLGVMASQCKTLADSLAVAEKYINFHTQGVVLQLETQGNVARMNYAVNMESDLDTTQLIEVAIGRIYSVLKALAPVGMPITGLSFTHAPLTSVEEYARVLGTTPRFEAETNSVSFPASYLNLPPAPASDRVQLYFESFLNHLGQSHSKPLKHQVLRLIDDLIPAGEATAATVASLLGMHTRSLQRQLKLFNTDFRTLLDEVRFERAKEILTSTDTPLTDLALQLGYSELSAFSRAFKRWSGDSPQRWRDSQADADENA